MTALRNLLRISEACQDLGPGVFRRPPGLHQRLDASLEVELHLVRDALLQPLTVAVQVEETLPAPPAHASASAGTSSTDRMARVLSIQP